MTKENRKINPKSPKEISQPDFEEKKVIECVEEQKVQVKAEENIPLTKSIQKVTKELVHPKPKHPTPSFLYFSIELQKRMASLGDLSISEIAQIAGKRWKNLNEKER